MRRAGAAALAGVAIAAWSGAGAAPLDPKVRRALDDELARSMSLALPGLAKPYFISYNYVAGDWVRVRARLGGMVDSDAYPHRGIDIVIRVGDRTFDNTNFGSARSVTGALAFEDDYGELRNQLWLLTDQEYKRAAEQLERKRAVVAGEAPVPDPPAAFSKEAASKVVDDGELPTLEAAKLEALAKRLSAVFRANPDVYDGAVSISAYRGKNVFLSSEGSAASQPIGLVRIEIDCETRAADGMTLRHSSNIWARTAAQLPSDKELVAHVERLSKELSAMRKAPIVEDYNGPVLFSGVAAGQVLRAVLVPHLTGTPPPKGERAGATEFADTELAGKIGRTILPPGVTLVDDPTVREIGRKKAVVSVHGGYRFDDEGVPGQRVSLVEGGAFKRFLMSRTPRKGVDRSNGHGRSGDGAPVRAHPSNLVVTSKKAVPDAAIKKRAVAAAKAEGLPYVIVIERLGDSMSDDMDPGLLTGDDTPLPRPSIMKRVYADGREELVRGATVATPRLAALRDLLAVGSTPVAYHYVGAGKPSRYEMFFRLQSGIPVSIVTPALLFRDVDVRKPTSPHRSAPIAPRPGP